MKQIIQDLKSGETILEDVPSPIVKRGSVLIKTTRSLVSLGTERMLVEFGKANFLQKAKQQPDKVKQVFDKMKTEGVMPTVNAVFNKLGQPLPLGYCNVGIIESVGEGVDDFKVGDRVVSNGPHAEFVCVPKNLVAHIPDDVSDDEAAFTVIGSIGLQGIRLANPTLGETFVVIGLGLIGLITAELLIANGCNVIGVDFDQQKVDMAIAKGVIAINPSNGEDSVKNVLDITNGIGADGVIITASTQSNEVIAQAAQMSRKRGRVVLVGVVGLNISRADFYEKEISFQVSCSYGPGRYDDDYELKGCDYPIGFVRWTEKRNFEAILNSISKGQLDVKRLITDRVPLVDYDRIYGNMRSGSIASILVYSDDSVKKSSIQIAGNNSVRKGALGIIGAGNFTSATVLPNLKGTGVRIRSIASAGGLNAKILGKRCSAEVVSSDYQELLKDDQIRTVMITTRHNLHAKMTIEALENDKDVFVEKPLALNFEELKLINDAVLNSKRNVVVGFNRRFSPYALKMKSLLGNAPMNIVATMNAGMIPSNVWVHDLKVGGGRIIGEACHFIDLCSFLTGSPVVEVCLNSLGKNPLENTDNASIMLKYENGSHAVINYFSNGAKSYPKERIECYSQEKVLVLDNWRRLEGFDVKGFSKMKGKLDKGHHNQFSLLVDRLDKGGAPLIPYNEIINTTIASFAAIKSLKENRWVRIDEYSL